MGGRRLQGLAREAGAWAVTEQHCLAGVGNLQQLSPRERLEGRWEAQPSGNAGSHLVIKWCWLQLGTCCRGQGAAPPQPLLVASWRPLWHCRRLHLPTSAPALLQTPCKLQV